ncbi:MULTISPECIES: hypothetical protein [unclassified Achromobacter]|uniref:hypothetical protein n=1 Tax=unclassified Achromobacter TaxID=2626865 RepID=UPI000B51A2FE|nr:MULTISPECIES: hypothetical protein [unclassified Achromobacter]OWT73711.1 hypothetical protein CEY05_21710 [Achromobacter sp. HZ34]OWT79373.1 hypothetical protein CEY04_10270 [Achromobacter sp. HZ28]
MNRLSNTVRGLAGAIPLALSLLLVTCNSHASEPDAESLTKTITDYLADRGHLCLAEYEWPRYVADDKSGNSRDALQMPVLEKLGLVSSTQMSVERTGDDGAKITAPGRRYDLTAAGQKFYLHKPVVVATANQHVTHDADFCVATLTLDKVIGWETPVKEQDGSSRTSVLYTYHIDPAPFTRDPDFQRVFPMVKRVVEGAGTMQLREGVRLTKDGWVAEEFFQR